MLDHGNSPPSADPCVSHDHTTGEGDGSSLHAIIFRLVYDSGTIFSEIFIYLLLFRVGKYSVIPNKHAIRCVFLL